MDKIEEFGASCTQAIEGFLGPNHDILYGAFVVLVTALVIIACARKSK